MIIGLANSKGGVGKSTIARNLVVYLNDLGYQTALLDAEADGPTATLLRKFDPNIVAVVATSIDAIDEAVNELQEKGLHVVIDAPGKEGDQLSALCLLSDFVMIPLCVSEQDLLQTVPVLSLVRMQQRRSRNGRPEASVVLTQTTKNDIGVPSVRKQLKKLGIPVAKSEIREIVGIKRQVAIMRDPKMFSGVGAANDFKHLFDEVVLSRLAKRKRRRVHEQ